VIWALLIAFHVLIAVIVLHLMLEKRRRRKFQLLLDEESHITVANWVMCQVCHDEYQGCTSHHEPHSVGECAKCRRVEPCISCIAPSYPARDYSKEQS
jgi:hypothetical protein